MKNLGANVFNLDIKKNTKSKSNIKFLNFDISKEKFLEKKLKSFNSVNFLDIDDPNSHGIARAYRVQAVPTIYIVDEEGTPIKAGSTMDVNGTLNFLGN